MLLAAARVPRHSATLTHRAPQASKKDYSLQLASQRTLEYGQVVLSADNVFNRCRQQSHVAHAPETHPLAQLDVIGQYVSDLLAICKRHGLPLSSS